MGIDVILFILVVIVISFIFGGMAIKWQNDFKLKQEELRAEGKGSSLATSELRGLIQEAMTDVVAPLDERLERIEMHMRQLPERASGHMTLESPDPAESNRN